MSATRNPVLPGPTGQSPGHSPQDTGWSASQLQYSVAPGSNREKTSRTVIHGPAPATGGPRTPNLTLAREAVWTQLSAYDAIHNRIECDQRVQVGAQPIVGNDVGKITLLPVQGHVVENHGVHEQIDGVSRRTGGCVDGAVGGVGPDLIRCRGRGVHHRAAGRV